MSQDKNTYEMDEIGTVKIADDVVALIAAFAALEVEGVASMAGGTTGEELSRGGMRKLGKSVKVDVKEEVKVDASVVIEYGYNIPSTSGQVQTRIKSSIENMTGLTVSNVDVHVAGIAINN